MPDSAKLKAAYARLEECVKEITSLEAVENYSQEPGLLTDWLLIAATQRYDGNGDGLTAIAYLMPDDQNVPHYRVLGLVDYVQIMLRKQIAED